METKNGIFAFIRHRDTGVRVTPKEAAKMMDEAGLNGGVYVPEYGGDRKIAGAVFDLMCRESTGNGNETRDVLRQVTRRKKTKVSFAIVHEEVTKNPAGKRVLDTNTVGSIDWEMDDNGDSIVTGLEGHPLYTRFCTLFEQWKGTLSTNDFTRHVAEILTDELIAIQMRNDGRIFWIPPATATDALQLQQAVKAVGVYVVLSPAEGDVAKEAIIDAITVGVKNSLDELAADVRGFDGTEKEGIFKTREKRLELIKSRVSFYKSVWVGPEDFHATLKETEEKLAALLATSAKEKEKEEEKKRKKREAKKAKAAEKKEAEKTAAKKPEVPTLGDEAVEEKQQQMAPIPPLPAAPPPPPPPPITGPQATFANVRIEFVSKKDNMLTFKSDIPYVIEHLKKTPEFLNKWVPIGSFGSVYFSIQDDALAWFYITPADETMIKGLAPGGSPLILHSVK